MIHIVTGKINSGKSTTISKIFNSNNAGDGFISIKRMYYDQVHGYDIVKLSDLTTKPLVIHEDFVDGFIETACQIGPYLFIKETLEYVEKQIVNMINSNIEPLYLDEIGELELYDQCFDKIFKKIIDSNVDCYITVRKDLVEKIIEKYNIKEVNIITM